LSRPNHQKYSEQELIAQLIAQDKLALEYLYDHFSQALYGIILRIVGSENIAQEVLQDVILKVWNNIGSYDSKKGRLFTWLLNLARNQAIDKLRSKEIQRQIKTDRLGNTVYILDQAKSEYPIKEDSIGIKELLERLVPEQRIVVELVYFRGYTQSEISKEFDIPLGTVKTRLRYALIALRKILN